MKKNAPKILILITILISNYTSAVTASGLGPRLENIVQRYTLQGEVSAREHVLQTDIRAKIVGNDVLIPVILDRHQSEAVLKRQSHALQKHGITQDSQSISFVRLMVPMRSLTAAASLLPTLKLRAPYPVTPMEGLGSVVHEGVSLTDAVSFQNAGFRGAGVKVAVVDLGFKYLSGAIAEGELPANTIPVTFSNGCYTNNSCSYADVEKVMDHGTEVAQYLMDMIPDAQLYTILISDEVDLQNAADYIRTNNITLANLSVGWVLSSYYDDSGTLNSILNQSYDTDGVFWAVAAGNQGKRHWSASWIDANGNNYHDNDGTDKIEVLTSATKSEGSLITLYLNWDQYSLNSPANIDLQLVNKNNVVVASSTNNNRFYGPIEVIEHSYSSADAPYYVKIKLSQGDPNGVELTLHSFTDNLANAVNTSSMLDPANAHGAYAVSTFRYNQWPNSPPALESFSSRGPTSDGRLGISMAAMDGGVYLNTSDGITWASKSGYGTSYASPVTLGAAALLKSKSPGLSAYDIRTQLSADAIDVGAAGDDSDYGSGKLFIVLDSDDDGIPDINDNCINIANSSQDDFDGDFLGDACDDDDDNDTLLDSEEDLNGNGVWDSGETNSLDADTDDDGIDDGLDAFPLDPTESLDSDHDGIGDNADSDDDNDGVPDVVDAFPFDPTESLDTDGDGIGNNADLDDDNDGLDDSFESIIGTSTVDIDTDGDGLSDYTEVAFDGDDSDYNSSSDLNPLSMDTDGDTYSDSWDPIPLLTNLEDADLAPAGAPDGSLNAADLLIAIQIATGERTVTDLELAHGDLYPPGNPDGVINLQDVILIQKLILMTP